MMPKSFKQYLAEDAIDPKTFDLKSLYDTLNQQLWDGKLPDIPVVFGKTRKGVGGVCSYKILVNSLKPDPLAPKDLKITMANRPFDEIKLKGLLAHEMVHASIAIRRIRENNSHGARFLAARDEAQKKADFDIPLTDESIESEYEPVKKETLVIIYHKVNDSRPWFGFLSSKLEKEMLAIIEATLWISGIKRVQLGYTKSYLAQILPVQRAIKYGRPDMYRVRPESFSSIEKDLRVILDKEVSPSYVSSDPPQ